MLEKRRSTLFFRLGLLTLSLLVGCDGNSGNNSGMSHSEKIKLHQYIVSGRQLYTRHCSNCHQQEGQGLAKLYPPLDRSDFVDNHLGRVICIMKHGIEGEIVVNGVTYNQPMPAIPELTHLEIAEIATYIYNSWGREQGLVDVKTVGKVLESCSD